MHDLRGELPCSTLRDKVRVFATVCNGKNRHKGEVHRDRRPDNVFITRVERVKIFDFGLAKQTHATVASAERLVDPVAIWSGSETSGVTSQVPRG